MKIDNQEKSQKIITLVNNKIQGIDMVAKVDEYRAYGGIIRATKGKLLEELCKDLLRIAWDELGGKYSDLSFSDTTISIPLKREYIQTISSPEIRNWILANYPDFIFRAQVDTHVLVRNKFVLGVECKAYTENAMLKRILVDFTLLKSKFPNLKCGLLQLESQLTGDYSQISKPIIYGSHSSHTLMSFFDVNLHVMTLLEGERKVDQPIHKREYNKLLTIQNTERVVLQMEELLREYL